MELMVTCRRHCDGRRVRCGVPLDVVQGRQPVGETRSMPLPLRHVRLVCHFDHLPRIAPSLEVERATTAMGPCCHLLAYRRFLFAIDPGGIAGARLLGVGTLPIRVDLCCCWHHCKFHPAEGAFQSGNVAFKPLIDSVSTAAVVWIIAEGVAYITGAVFYSLNNKRYMHSVFHFFVLLGSLCHIIAVWDVLMEYL